MITKDQISKSIKMAVIQFMGDIANAVPSEFGMIQLLITTLESTQDDEVAFHVSKCIRLFGDAITTQDVSIITSGEIFKRLIDECGYSCFTDSIRNNIINHVTNTLTDDDVQMVWQWLRSIYMLSQYCD